MNKYLLMLGSIFLSLSVESPIASAQGTQADFEPVAPISLEEPLCQINDEPESVQIHATPLASSRLYRSGDALEFTVASEPRGPVALKLNAWIGGEHRQGYLGPISRVILEGRSRQEVQIPLDSLSLPVETMAYSGQLVITAEVEYADGDVRPLNQALHFYFHPQGQGWLIYDQETRDRDFNHGVLDPRLNWLVEFSREDRTDMHFMPNKIDQIPGPSPRPGVDRNPNMYWPGLEPDANSPLSASDSFQANIKPGKKVDVCFKTTTYFTDAHPKQDYWTENIPYDRIVPGAKVVLYSVDEEDGDDPSQWVNRGTRYLNNKGCTGTVDLHSYPDSIVAFYYSETQWNGNKLKFESTQGHVAKLIVELEPAPKPDPQDTLSLPGPHVERFDVVNSTQDPRFNVQASMSVGIAAMGVPKDLLISYSNGPLPVVVGAPKSLTKGKGIDIDSTAYYKKFIHNHELGHVVQINYGELFSGGYAVDDDQCDDAAFPGNPNGNGHSMTSKEYVGAAINEGFAQFYAASVFNDEGEDDCGFYYYKYDDPQNRLVNCGSAGEGIFDLRYMETNCAQTPLAYRGVELDWFRLLWNLRTDKSYGEPPSLVEIIDWLNIDIPYKEKETDPSDDPSLVKALDLMAEKIEGSLRKSWDEKKTEFGVYH